MGAIREEAGGNAQFAPAKQKLLMRFNYFGQETELDGQGRLLLPQVLREKANLIAEVVVHGSEVHLKVFEP